MAPTRELAQQIQMVSNEFGLSSGVRNACLYGGAHKGAQVNQLRNAQLAIGTPGRLIDLISTGQMSLGACSFLVLDEADRMLDMGFEPQIRQIIDQIRPDRQTLMFSATWPREVRTLAQEYLQEFTQVKIGSTELRANPNIKQIIKPCSSYEKEEEFLNVIKSNHAEQGGNAKTLIFTQTKRMADQIAHKIYRMGIQCAAIHGDKSQSQRESILRDFRNNQLQVVVATDVAARGLDVNDISYVINYDMPENITDYIHRIGRTGRHNKTGTAYSFVTEVNAGLVPDLVTVLRQANQEVDPKLLEFDSGRNSPSSSSRGGYRRY